MGRFYKNAKHVQYTPFVTTALLEFANVAQLWKMWTTHTALGQNIWSWVMVNVALILWLNWYTVFTPHQRFAIWSCRIGIGINVVVIASVYLLS